MANEFLMQMIERESYNDTDFSREFRNGLMEDLLMGQEEEWFENKRKLEQKKGKIETELKNLRRAQYDFEKQAKEQFKDLTINMTKQFTSIENSLNIIAEMLDIIIEEREEENDIKKLMKKTNFDVNNI